MEDEKKILEIDIETYSDVNLGDCGVYKYAESPNFEILLFGYSINGSPVQVIDLACGEEMPERIKEAIQSKDVIKIAHNASFERICLSRYLGLPTGAYLDPASWRCSMVMSAYNGLPLSLKGVGSALGLDKQKLEEGKDLIRYFCIPCKPTKTNGERTRNLPEHAPEKWELFKKYNIRDVETEQGIVERLSKYPIPDFVWKEYAISERINDRGIQIDRSFVDGCLSIDKRSKTDMTEELTRITGLSNPNSVPQLSGWLKEKGVKVTSLDKKSVKQLIKETDGDVRRALVLRSRLSKTSIKKYEAMKNSACQDNRCHGMFMFYGANRTGRFAGRIVQLQNLSKNHMSDLDSPRELIRRKDYDSLNMLYDNIPDVLSQLVRTAFIPAPGYKYIVADFSAIEARVLSWLAGETWRMEVFKNGGDIYCETAERMFHCKVVKNGENGELRQKGKQCELACGYGGSKGAMIAMGAIEAGMAEDELQPLVDAWRAANPKIVELWWAVDRAVKTVIRTGKTEEVNGIVFYLQSHVLFIRLPSGRTLSYIKPKIEANQYGGESVVYMFTNSQNKWGHVESYGPKFIENIVQGISRDILCYAMTTMKDYRICAHVHDECIIEVPKTETVEHICSLMNRTPSWAPGLVLNSDGYECSYYEKL
jgi:DNA polymerase